MSAALETPRLRLRRPTSGDAPALIRLAGRREIADTTISIPHPYTEQHALDWIQSAKGTLVACSNNSSGRESAPFSTVVVEASLSGRTSAATEKESFHGLPGATRQLNFVITLRSTQRLIGAVGLRELDAEHHQAELGVWIGVEHWGRGYATEAVTAVVHHAFDVLGLNRVHAHHMVRNPASGRVLEKAGFRREGLLRQRVRKWGIYEDVVVLAILRTDWQQQCARGGEAFIAVRPVTPTLPDA